MGYRKILFFGMLVLLAGVLVACSPETEDTYVIGDEQGDWGFPSPFATYPRGPGFVRTSLIFDSLIWKDEDGFVGALAEEWSLDEEELIYTFELREDVKWHDGDTFTAEDVVFTYEYFQEHSFAFAEVDNVKEVEKIDDYRVEMRLKEPDASFINNVAGVVPVIPAHIWEDVEDPEEFTGPEAVIGSGPYRLEDYNREQGRYRYTAFEDYFLGNPGVDNMLMVQVGDPQLELQKGNVDYVRIQPEAAEELEKQGLNVEAGTHDWNLKLMFNHREAPFEEVEFRRALALGIDLEELVERALRGHGLPGSPGMLSPDNRWYCQEIPDYSFDPESAEEKLEKLGYSREGEHLVDENSEEISVELLGLADYAREAEIVAEHLEELGIEVELRTGERSVVDAAIRNWNFDLAITGHGAVGGDPDVASRFMVGKSSPHLNARYEDEELIDLLRRQGRELDAEKREDLVCRVQQVYAEELPSYTLHHPTWYYGFNDEVDWFFTRDGLGSGIPMPLNKLALVE